jgi:hypothetical protein
MSALGVPKPYWEQLGKTTYARGPEHVVGRTPALLTYKASGSQVAY